MKKVLRDESGKRIHPYVPELCDQLSKGQIDRREFLRTTCLLGVSATAAYAMAGKITGEHAVPRAAASETPKEGGILRSAMQVQRMDDPATYDWVQMSNQTRHILEYLVETGPDNVTRPYLAESWEASDDLKTWTFKLRQDVTWSNGDQFNADDMVHNFTRWLDPSIGSSNMGLFSAMTTEYDTGEKNDDGSPKMGRKMREGSIERVDDFTVALHLNSPVLTIPENLFNYPTAIVHRSFDDTGANLAENPIGTGPYTLGDYAVGERCQLIRREGNHWTGPVYLQEIIYQDYGSDPSAQLNALTSGQVDHVYEVAVANVEEVEKLPGIKLYDVTTAQTAAIRFKVTQPPFNNKALRQAILACIDHDRMLQIAYLGKGSPGEDHHVAPIHPEYFALPKKTQDYELARKLLAEAGYNGEELTLDVNNATPWEQMACQLVKDQCGPAGINVRLNVMPAAQYWDIWTTTPWGATTWTHRPLGVMVLNLAYRSGMAWNESGYANPEFDQLLDIASGTLDINERRKKIEPLEKMMQEDAITIIPLWRSVMMAANEKVRDIKAHPTVYHLWNKVWIA